MSRCIGFFPRISLASAICIGLSVTPAAAQWVPIDLGTLGGRDSRARDVNGSGRIVGDSEVPPADPCCAFSWTQAEGMINLGNGGLGTAVPFRINDNGQVVGLVQIGASSDVHPFSWTLTDGWVDLDVNVPFGFSTPLAVNVVGQVASSFQNPSAPRHAFLWSRADGFIDLGAGVANALNDSGQVVGWYDSGSSPLAFSWTEEDGRIDLGTLGGTYSVAKAVNAAGQVVGESAIAGDNTSHAFLWTATEGMIDLGSLGGGRVTAVNSSGQLVGYRYTPTGVFSFSWTKATGIVDLGPFQGDLLGVGNGVSINNNGQVVWGTFSWTAANGLLELPSLGGFSSQAVDVNDRGQIVGSSLIAGNTGFHSVLWQPIANLGCGKRLAGCNLKGVNLAGAYLKGAQLSGANLRDANFSRANLVGANLTKANLKGTAFTGATLFGAQLDGANTDALWSNTICPDGTNSDSNGGTCIGHLHD